MADDNYLRTADDDYIICRLFRHAWKFNGKKKIVEGGASYTVLYLECRSCGCKRADYLDARRDLQDRVYDYPPGYQRKGQGGNRLSVVDIRKELLRRVK